MQSWLLSAALLAFAMGLAHSLLGERCSRFRHLSWIAFPAIGWIALVAARA